MQKIILSSFFVLCLLLSGCTTNNNPVDKTADECTIDSDCEWSWMTGSCHTPEWVAQRVKENEEKGIYPHAGGGEPKKCKCDQKKCFEK